MQLGFLFGYNSSITTRISKSQLGFRKFQLGYQGNSIPIGICGALSLKLSKRGPNDPFLKASVRELRKFQLEYRYHSSNSATLIYLQNENTRITTGN